MALLAIPILAKALETVRALPLLVALDVLSADLAGEFVLWL
jgi:hypothetical protein